jgi:hypothetical protein
LNEFRDRAKALAPQLTLADSFTHLDDALGSALGTREIETGSSALSAAVKGLPYDERCIRRLRVLAEYLASLAPAPRPFIDEVGEKLPTLAFFEAYFSNFIEGTEFTVDEAQDIVFKNQIPSARPEDAHDILGTYRVVADDTEMQQRPSTLDGLLKLLSLRHARILEGRPEKRPGQFIERSNRVGDTEFVAPDLVKGTLAKGLEQLESLHEPFARGVYMMFLISEVHPFDDGNGRVARVMMNAELHAAGEYRIIIPTVYRSEYLSGLRALTHHERPTPLVRVLDFAQRYTAQLNFSSLARAKAVLEDTHAFETPERAADLGIRLTLPSAIEW